MRRLLVRGLVALVLLALVALASVGWDYSDQILQVEAGGPPTYDLTVSASADGQVTLAGEDAARPGVWGLRTPDGYAQVGPATSTGAGEATRPLRPLPGTPSPGDPAQLDGYAYPDDPSVFAFEVEDVSIEGPLGDYPAYHVPGDGDVWVVAVHGRGARRSEAFRLLPTLADLGMPVLVPTYRNDEGAPAAPDERYRLGWSEWEDVAAAVDWALERGARDVVLVGYSMGGSVVASYLREAGEDRVAGVLLDAPVTDWGATLRLAAIDRGVPTWLTPIAQTVVSVRTGIRWSELNLIAWAEDLAVPVLLFHGDADPTVPVASSDALAEARPDLVTYVRVPGAVHVGAWNADPAAYDAAVRAFLAEILGG